jgi:hypothetical protein
VVEVESQGFVVVHIVVLVVSRDYIDSGPWEISCLGRLWDGTCLYKTPQCQFVRALENRAVSHVLQDNDFASQGEVL